MHRDVLGYLYGFQEKRKHKARDTLSLKMFKMRFLRFPKPLKTTWNSPKKPVELTQKQETTTTVPQLWYSYVVMLLKLTVQIQLALYPCDPFFINNLSMTGNSLEKNCVLV